MSFTETPMRIFRKIDHGYRENVFPGGSDSKESACNVGDLGLISGLGRSHGGGHGNLPPYSGLENSMDCTVHEVSESRIRLSDFYVTSHHITGLENVVGICGSVIGFSHLASHSLL